MDDTSAQITWRGLRPGTLGVRSATSITRRHLDRSAARTGAITLGGLTPGREHRLVLDGDAVASRAELTVVTRERLPGEAGARVATLSDLHLGTTSFGHFGTITESDPAVAHPQRCARAALVTATRWGAEHIVVKGDLTEAGRISQWRAYAELVADQPVPIDAIPGNHDRVGLGRRDCLAPETASELYGFSMVSPMVVRDLPALRLILIDTTRSDRHGGSVAAVADDVVDAVAELRGHGNVLVLAHHQIDPLLRAEGWPPGVDRAEAARFLRRLGAVHPRVLVTSGHTHRHRRRTRGGATSTQVGSVKDYPGVWASYVAHEGGIRQTVRRVEQEDCVTWVDQTRRAVLGGWRWIAPGRRSARDVDLTGPSRTEPT